MDIKKLFIVAFLLWSEEKKYSEYESYIILEDILDIFQTNILDRFKATKIIQKDGGRADQYSPGGVVTLKNLFEFRLYCSRQLSNSCQIKYDKFINTFKKVLVILDSKKFYRYSSTMDLKKITLGMFLNGISAREIYRIIGKFPKVYKNFRKYKKRYEEVLEVKIPSQEFDFIKSMARQTDFKNFLI